MMVDDEADHPSVIVVKAPRLFGLKEKIIVNKQGRHDQGPRSRSIQRV